MIFSQTSIWEGLGCGREPCVTCNQGGEDTPDCTKTGVVYESICSRCNPSSLNKGELKSQESVAPSLYVGESSRSIQERAKEHWGAALKKDAKSHMVKHQNLEHPGEPPEFLFKVVSTHKTALSRQIREAVRIKRRGEASNILNSRSEFNRCYIPRLVVEVEDEEQQKSREQRDREENELLMEENDKLWSNGKLRQQQMTLTKRRRLSDREEEGSNDYLVGRRRKRLKFALKSEDWGDTIV